MSTVIIMRGTSGSGKSTFVDEHVPRGKVICSADHYFITSDGKYNFDVSRLDEAHTWCFKNYLSALQHNAPIIVVDNTNIQLWEMSPYIQLAKVFGADLKIIRCVCPAPVAALRNTHGVPASTIDNMLRRMDTLPRHWPKEEVVITYKEQT